MPGNLDLRMHSLPYMSACSLRERWSSYLQYAALYIDGEYVGHPDWIELGECVSCFIFNTKNIKKTAHRQQ